MIDMWKNNATNNARKKLPQMLVDALLLGLSAGLIFVCDVLNILDLLNMFKIIRFSREERWTPLFRLYNLFMKGLYLSSESTWSDLAEKGVMGLPIASFGSLWTGCWGSPISSGCSAWRDWASKTSRPRLRKTGDGPGHAETGKRWTGPAWTLSSWVVCTLSQFLQISPESLPFLIEFHNPLPDAGLPVCLRHPEKF